MGVGKGRGKDDDEDNLFLELPWCGQNSERGSGVALVRSRIAQRFGVALSEKCSTSVWSGLGPSVRLIRRGEVVTRPLTDPLHLSPYPRGAPEGKTKGRRPSGSRVPALPLH